MLSCINVNIKRNNTPFKIYLKNKYDNACRTTTSRNATHTATRIATRIAASTCPCTVRDHSDYTCASQRLLIYESDGMGLD
jgi:hypothetical protein